MRVIRHELKERHATILHKAVFPANATHAT